MANLTCNNSACCDSVWQESGDVILQICPALFGGCSQYVVAYIEGHGVCLVHTLSYPCMFISVLCMFVRVSVCLCVVFTGLPLNILYWGMWVQVAPSSVCEPQHWFLFNEPVHSEYLDKMVFNV